MGSGLIAARDMEKQGLSVQVVEANRLGGRLQREELSATQSVDLGGQWIGKGHEKLEALCNELGLKTFESEQLVSGAVAHFDGLTVELGTEMSLWDWKLPSAWNATLKSGPWMDASHCIYEFVLKAASMPDVEFPYQLPAQWLQEDTKTVHEWVRDATISEKGAQLCEAVLQAFSVAPTMPPTISVLYNLWQQKTTDYLLTTGNTNPFYKIIHGGAGQLPQLLEANLSSRAILGDPVVQIQQANGVATVHTLSGKKLLAKNVVVAVPPHLTGRIIYDPPLPWKRMQLNQALPLTRVAKILVGYPKRFWRNGNEGVRAIVNFGNGTYTVCLDSTDPRSTKGHLICLAVMQQHDNAMAYAEGTPRKDAILQELARDLGPEALEPDYFNFVDWVSTPFVEGGYGSYGTPLAWSHFGESFVQPHGVIQWASEAVSPRWNNYMEGAIIAGERAAQNVIRRNPAAPKSSGALRGTTKAPMAGN